MPATTVIASLSWKNMASMPAASPEFHQAVLTTVHTEVPRAVRDEWLSLTIEVNENGGVGQPERRAFVVGLVDRLNAVRHAAHGPEIPDFSLAHESTEGCHYVFEGGVRVCYYTSGLLLGGEVWEVDDPTNGCPDAVLGLRIRWQGPVPESGS